MRSAVAFFLILSLILSIGWARECDSTFYQKIVKFSALASFDKEATFYLVQGQVSHFSPSYSTFLYKENSVCYNLGVSPNDTSLSLLNASISSKVETIGGAESVFSDLERLFNLDTREIPIPRDYINNSVLVYIGNYNGSYVGLFLEKIKSRARKQNYLFRFSNKCIILDKSAKLSILGQGKCDSLFSEIEKHRGETVEAGKRF